MTLHAEQKHLPKRYNPEQSYVVPVEAESPPAVFAARIAVADKLLEAEPFLVEADKQGAAKVFRHRPVVLACYEESIKKWHLVHVSIPYPAPKEYFKKLKSAQTIADREAVHIPITVLSKGYTAEHVVGVGGVRLLINVFRTEGDRKIQLPVYRMRFSRLQGKDDINFDRALKRMQATHYTPLAKAFSSKALAKEGECFLHKHVVEANQSLKRQMVYSKAFPNKLLGDVFPSEVVVALMISEQWDPLYFALDQKQSLERILSEYAINREHAYAWSSSIANAIGCLQFTNAKGNGTYANVVRRYKEAALKDDFELGARDMHNVVRAAICLLDLELSGSKKATALFLEDPVLGSIYAIAAYNGGAFAGMRMLEGIERINGKPLAKLDAALMKLPKAIRSVFGVERAIKKGKRNAATKAVRMNTETPIYVKKFLFLMEYLD